jgi:hypothetical protein
VRRAWRPAEPPGTRPRPPLAKPRPVALPEPESSLRLAAKTVCNIHNMLHDAPLRAGRAAPPRPRLDGRRVIPRCPRVVVDHQVVVGGPKTDRSRRGLAVDGVTLEALREHLERQDAERARLELPPAGPDTPLFTWPDGRGIHPDLITDWLQQHARRAGLPVIRLHDVRHSYATAAGRPASTPRC